MSWCNDRSCTRNFDHFVWSHQPDHCIMRGEVHRVEEKCHDIDAFPNGESNTSVSPCRGNPILWMKQRIEQLKRERGLALSELHRRGSIDSSALIGMTGVADRPTAKESITRDFRNAPTRNFVTAEGTRDRSLRLQRKIIEAKFSDTITRVLTHVRVSLVLPNEI